MTIPFVSRAALFAGIAAIPTAPLVSSRADYPPSAPIVSAERRWTFNTHVFAANKALADAMDNERVTIPPFGEFPVAASALRALSAMPSAYRAGAIAPDLFPDMYVGGWVIHSDFAAKSQGWNADGWLRHMWTSARQWSVPAERDKVLAFAYGFLTHAAGDAFAHTYVNQKAGGAWVTFTGPARETALKHVVLESYVGQHTPPTDLTLDVWPRLVSEVLIKNPDARRHSEDAKHYQTFLKIYDWLGPQIERAKREMNNGVSDEAPYWVKCGRNSVACGKKEQMETWRLDIDRGLRALIDSGQTLGERSMANETGDGIRAMTGWTTEWLPKMFGAHAIGEGAGALRAFLDWVGDPLAPVSLAIKAETERFFDETFPQYYRLYQEAVRLLESARDPATWMTQVGFPSGTKATVNTEMGIGSDPNASFNWQTFEPIYNTVILAKLILLDGDGLNELGRRAGVSAQLFAPGENTNIMLGVFRSLTQSYQWIGDTVQTDTGTTITKFGICGPEGGSSLPKSAVCGLNGGPLRGPIPGASLRATEGGFVLWRHAEAREKIFTRIFKGFGAGPGMSAQSIIVRDMRPVSAIVIRGARALSASSNHVDAMREIVAVMRGKISGVASAALTSVQPARGAARGVTVRGTVPPPATGAAQQPAVHWGQSCCANDIAELRAALALIQTHSRALQGPALAAQLDRRANLQQLGTFVTQLNAAIDVFENTRDERTAAAALDTISRLINAMGALVTGT